MYKRGKFHKNQLILCHIVSQKKLVLLRNNEVLKQWWLLYLGLRPRFCSRKKECHFLIGLWTSPCIWLLGSSIKCIKFLLTLSSTSILVMHLNIFHSLLVFCMSRLSVLFLTTNWYVSLTAVHPWCDGHSTSISAYGVWGVRAGVQVSRREFHTHIHLD